MHMGATRELLERRAEAVKRYLVENFNIPAENLSTAGFGKRVQKQGRPLRAGASTRSDRQYGLAEKSLPLATRGSDAKGALRCPSGNVGYCALLPCARAL
jgi:hypothetical protein